LAVSRGVDVQQRRREKDHYFGGPHDSPLTVEQRRSFTGLKYFDPDPASPMPDSVAVAPISVSASSRRAARCNITHLKIDTGFGFAFGNETVFRS
jgi:hypothetical protein